MRDWQRRRIVAVKEAYDLAEWLDAAADCLLVRGWIPWHLKPHDDALTDHICEFAQSQRSIEEMAAELRRLAEQYYYIGSNLR